MTRIGIVSDTHGYIDESLLEFFSDCNQVWHAGDIGDLKVTEAIAQKFELKAVFGNIDGTDARMLFNENNKFKCENLNIWITHIGGYPGNYDYRIKNELISNPPDIFVAGHSHILKIIYDKKYNFLHINPGAYGKSGFHKIRTAVKFDIDKSEILNMQILEKDR
jgi:putative phosphoesterase